MKPEDSAFPICIATFDTGKEFRNTVVGGLSKRDYIAVELLSSFCANPNGMDNDECVESAIKVANGMVKSLQESALNEK